jgi:hypothetical protein
MLLASRLLPGLALAAAVTLIASVATAAPISLVSGPGAAAVLDAPNEFRAGILGFDNDNVAEPLSSVGHVSFPGEGSQDNPSAIGLVEMEDRVFQEPLVVSEPASLVLTGLGLAGLAALGGRRWQRHSRRRRRPR